MKVDREERPDVDAIYMDAVQAMTGQGGWPLNAFLTPEGVPFFGGTYFPPETRHGMPSWQDLLVGVWNAWTTQRDGDRRRRRRRTCRDCRARVPGGADSEVSRVRAAGRGVGSAPAVRRGERRLGRRAQVPLDVGHRVPAGARRDRDAAADAAADGRGRDLRPGRRWLRALLGRCALARPALREDALRQRAAGPRVSARLPGIREPLFRRVCEETLDWAMRELRQDEGGFASSLERTPRASRASSTSGLPRRSARRWAIRSARWRSRTSG